MLRDAHLEATTSVHIMPHVADRCMARPAAVCRETRDTHAELHTTLSVTDLILGPRTCPRLPRRVYTTLSGTMERALGLQG